MPDTTATITPLFTRAVIADRVRELSVQINTAYRSLVTERNPLVLVGVLNGCLPFLADLSRELRVPHTIETVRAISYRGTSKRDEGGTLFQCWDKATNPLDERHVLIVDDIYDSGETLDVVRGLLFDYNPATLHTVVLLAKQRPDRGPVTAYPDYVGFDCPDVFVVGYGLDLDGLHRGLPFVGVRG